MTKKVAKNKTSVPVLTSPYHDMIVLQEELIVRDPKTKEEICYINAKLLDKQKAWDNLEKIKKLHVQKFTTIKAMEKATDLFKIRAYSDTVTQIEFKLQDAWGFPRNASFHRFWQLPHCRCPKMDNEDAYGTMFNFINVLCPVHKKTEVDNDDSK